jgi:hypothetical protein
VGPYWFKRRRKNWSRFGFLNFYRWRVPAVPPVGAGISFDLYLWSFPTIEG